PKIACWKIKDLRVQTFLFSIICDRTLMPPGAPRPMKIGWPYALPEEHDRMPPKGLGVRSCSDWCPEPVTELDLDTCRHHELLPASPREVEHARQPLSLRVSRQSLECMEVQDGSSVYAVRRLACP